MRRNLKEHNLYINVAVTRSSSKLTDHISYHIICYVSTSNVRSSVFLYWTSDRKVNSAKPKFVVSPYRLPKDLKIVTMQQLALVKNTAKRNFHFNVEIQHKVVSHKRYRQSSEPIKTQSNHVIGLKRGKTCVSESRLVGFTSNHRDERLQVTQVFQYKTRNVEIQN